MLGPPARYINRSTQTAVIALCLAALTSVSPACAQQLAPRKPRSAEVAKLVYDDFNSRPLLWQKDKSGKDYGAEFLWFDEAVGAAAGNQNNPTARRGSELLTFTAGCDRMTYVLYRANPNKPPPIWQAMAELSARPGAVLADLPLSDRNNLFKLAHAARLFPLEDGCTPTPVAIILEDGRSLRLALTDTGSPLVAARVDDEAIQSVTRPPQKNSAGQPTAEDDTAKRKVAVFGPTGQRNGFTDARLAVGVARQLSGTKVMVEHGGKLAIYYTPADLMTRYPDDAALTAAVRTTSIAPGYAIRGFVIGQGSATRVVAIN